MALSVVNGVTALANTAATTSLTTAGISITAGNLIVVGVANYDTSGANQDSSVTDSAGNTYTKIGSSAEAGNIHVSLYYAKNVLGGASVTFTYTLLNTGQFPRIDVIQVAGADTVAPLDQGSGTTFAIATLSGTTLATPSVTTTAANEILVVIGADTGSTGTEAWTDAGAATGGWTQDNANTATGAGLSTSLAHAIVAATGTFAATQTTSAAQGNRAVGIATFKAASAGPPTAGTLTLGTTGATTQALSLATNSGGTAPYSNQLQQAPDNAGAPGAWANVGAAVAGATATWTVTALTPGTKYWWRVVVTDNAAATANSNQVTVTLSQTTITAPSPAKLAANTSGNTVSVTGNGAWTAGTAEVQSLIATGATAGTFTLSFGGQTTAAIAYNATAAAVQSALQALSSIGAGNVTCTGGPLPGTAVTITFSGTLAPGPQALITSTSTGLTGGTATVTRTTAGVAATSFAAAGLTGSAVTKATITDATHATLTVTSSTVDSSGTVTISNGADPSVATISVVSSGGGKRVSGQLRRMR